MGLFDKRKKSDDFDSPVESIDLSAPPEPEPVPEPAPRSLAPEEPVARQAQTEREPEPEPEPEWDPPAYGINDAIQLMRALPQDNVELVVQVVTRTLESTKVKVSHIIEDATRKQKNIEGRIEVLKREIAEFEAEIATRKDEINKLEADHDETSTVKDRLQLAEKLTDAPSSSASAPAAAGAPRPKTTTGAPPFGKAPPPSPSPGPSSSGGPTGPGGKGTTIVAKK